MIKSNKAEKFNSQPLKRVYFKNGAGGPTLVLPEITAISAIANGSEAPAHLQGRCCYNVYMVDLNTPLAFLFKDMEKATQSRNKLIVQLIEFWGSNTVFFSNGADGWITVVSAIRAVTDVFDRAGHAVFSASVSNVATNIDFTFADNFTAAKQRKAILARIERLWIERSRTRDIKQIYN